MSINMKMFADLIRVQDMALGFSDEGHPEMYKSDAEMMDEMKYCRSLYFEKGHMNEELFREDRETWKSEISFIQKVIRKWSK